MNKIKENKKTWNNKINPQNKLKEKKTTQNKNETKKHKI